MSSLCGTLDKLLTSEAHFYANAVLLSLRQLFLNNSIW